MSNINLNRYRPTRQSRETGSRKGREGGDVKQGEIQEEEVTKVSVKPFAGRLSLFYEKWTSITSNKTILKWVRGYHIPLNQTPVQYVHPRSIQFSENEFPQTSAEILKLFVEGAVVKCEPLHDQFLSTFFLADKPNGKKRFILNLKKFNTYVEVPHFKLEDTRTVLRLIQKNCFLTCIDLKDAYFSVPVAKQHRKYLRFKFITTRSMSSHVFHSAWRPLLMHSQKFLNL